MSDLLDIGRAGRDQGGTGLVVRVLGPTHVERDGDIAAIGGPPSRGPRPPRPADRGLVTADRLVEDVWGEDAPHRGRHAAQPRLPPAQGARRR